MSAQGMLKSTIVLRITLRWLFVEFNKTSVLKKSATTFLLSEACVHLKNSAFTEKICYTAYSYSYPEPGGKLK